MEFCFYDMVIKRLCKTIFLTPEALCTNNYGTYLLKMPGANKTR
jgi:hypothetical protein